MTKSARDEFAPPRQTEDLTHLLKNSRIKQELQGIGNHMKQAGVKHEGHQSHLSLVKNDRPADHAAHKDLGVKAGDRPAFSPCDGKMQANTMAEVKKAGEALKQAGVTGGQSQSAAKQLAPSHTPSVPAQSAGGRSR